MPSIYSANGKGSASPSRAFARATMTLAHRCVREAAQYDGDHAFDRVVSALRERGRQIRLVSTNSVRAQCPAHLDDRPSLGVTLKDGKVLLHCFAGCRTSDVVRALGLRMADLFATNSRPSARPEIVAVYDYYDLDGVLVAQKVRFSNKTFRWRSPGAQPNSWRWRLSDGQQPRLYRLPELIGARLVFLVEGEKAADTLHLLGLASTCAPYGASTWTPGFTEDLIAVGRPQVVLCLITTALGSSTASVSPVPCTRRPSTYRW
jgi:hypothetical protein